MPFLRIDGLRTVNQQGQDVTLFDPFDDALSLTLDFHASPDLLALPDAHMSAEFQIFDPHLHTVVVHSYWGTYFNWGEYFWISKGNNWGPPSSYQTAEAWGLNWIASSVFGFRGIVRAFYTPSPGAGSVTVDAFDVSPMRWFRVKEVFRL